MIPISDGRGRSNFCPAWADSWAATLLCGIVATRLDEQTRPCALFDIGTNGEVVVGSCSLGANDP